MTSHDQQPLADRGPLSPSTLRDAAQSHSNSNLNPRNASGYRTDERSYHATQVAVAGTWKPTPSPLHTSFRPHSPSKDEVVGETPLSHSSPPKSVASNSSLDPQLRAIQLPHSSLPTSPILRSQSPPGTAPGPSGKGSGDVRPGHGEEMLKGYQSTSMADISGSAQPLESPPSSPIASLPSKTGERPGKRTMPRTSSIDSAISSISSASHSHKSSFDSNSITTADINNLISAAGSAEAVIIHLLKEKHHAASQNTQLWRLVDKQRTLVLGLNKDLDRALKDKEKYRKKVKELQSQAPPLPAKSSQSDEITPAFDNPSPGDDESNVLEPSRDTEATLSASGGPKQMSGLEKGRQAEIMDPVPSSSHLRATAGIAEGDLHPLVNKLKTANSVSNVSSYPGDGSFHRNEAPRLLVSGSSPIESDETILAVAQGHTAHTSAVQSTHDPYEKVPPPSRKPPPAPLNLGTKHSTSSQHHETIVDDSESEYGDSVEVDEIIPLERGRRRTREDDDKEREAALLREQEARSRSKKKMMISGKVADDQPKPTPQPAFIGLPSSPRQTAPQLHTFGEHLPLPEPGPSVLTSQTPESTERLIVSPPPMSPGLPVSPRPVDRPIGSPLPRLPRDNAIIITSPPVSPIPGLPSSPRATKPGMSLMPLASTAVSLQPVTKTNGTLSFPANADASARVIPSIDALVRVDSPGLPCDVGNKIYQGLISDEYPDLLLPPNALPSIEVKVSSSRLRPSRNSYLALKPSEEEPVFTLSVFSRADRSELWRLEKVIMALSHLDSQIRELCDLPVKLPDRSIFSGHSPAKVDARRAALNAYFDTLLDTPLDESAALTLCRFLTLDAIEPRDDEINLLRVNGKATAEALRDPDGKLRKEGYLTKRGKNFGGWKPRYFVLHGPELKYFESPGGAHLGNIKLYNAQIGKQSQSGHNQPPSQNDDDSDNQYRHAFLILEPKRKDSSALVRHVLCAESDEERDAWVDALLQYVENHTSEDEKLNTKFSKGQHQLQGKLTTSTGAKSRLFTSGSKRINRADSPEKDLSDTIPSFSYDDAVAAEPPIYGLSPETDSGKLASGPSGSLTESMGNRGVSDHGTLTSHSSKIISGPTNGAVIQDVGAWGNRLATTAKEKKRSLWNFRARSSSDLASQAQGVNDYPGPSTYSNPLMEGREAIRPVFGIPLCEAVQFCPPQGINVDLPAVVYRCIEYLEAKGAASEEGIFRLSGSNIVVKALKERFNIEGDVDFLADDHYYDVHAVASLFKQYLRELPTTVLTRELHIDFLRVLELDERIKKIAAFNSLVHKLPRPNLALLRALAQFLIGIVNNSNVNKMTVRNVGIVFAPTLNIPAPVFSMFLTDFGSIFGHAPDVAMVTVELPKDVSLPPDVRSPRHQMFSEIPTPAYNQTSFQASENPTQPSMEGPRSNYDTGFIPIHPAYDQSFVSETSNRLQADSSQFSSLNRILAPSNDNSQSVKAKRRESSLFFMDLGHRKASLTKMRDDQAPLPEESSI